ncbi:MAG: DUF1614 domain-containing protein [Methanosarcinales archaeon]|nr:DUF1614 domain-containing protein [Methanosarcinales archaeon]
MRGMISGQDLKTAALFGCILIPVFYLCYIGSLGSQWHINSLVLFVLLSAMLLLSATEIPIYRIRTKKPDLSDDKKELLGEIYSIPLIEEYEADDELVFHTSITLNVGGFILPLILALYVAIMNPGFAALEIMLIIIVAAYLFIDIKSGVGIIIPDYIGLLAVPFALILEPGSTSTIVLISGVLGILIGMVTSLCKIDENKEGSAYINLGGVGNFKAIYVTVIIAALLSYLPV